VKPTHASAMSSVFTLLFCLWSNSSAHMQEEYTLIQACALGNVLLQWKNSLM
jgi:lipoprotein signal peptidase